jgi:carbamoyltransferase
MNVLGLVTFFHDSAACLIQDGRIVAMAEEERFNRKKRTGVFPLESIRFCLDRAGLDPSDIDHVAYYFTLGGYLRRMAHNALIGFPRSFNLLRQGAAYMPVHERLWSMARLKSIVARELDLSRPGFTTHLVPHPLSHAAAGFYPGPFDKATIMTFDAAGEGASTQVFIGRGGRIEPVKGGALSSFPHSVAGLYASLTEFLGFTVGTDEYKVMGLSAFGQPNFRDKFDELIRFEDGRLRLDLDYFSFHTHGNRRFAGPRMAELFGPAREPETELTERHQDIAASLQKTLEDLALDMARWAQQKTGDDNLCIAGGVALNCLMNRRLILEGPFENVYIQPIAHDGGCALGAAAYVAHHLQGQTKRHHLTDLYLGPEYDEPAAMAALKERGVDYVRLEDDELFDYAAAQLAEGRIVGWFQGRMEAGPRALGNRSLLADARRAEMKDIINRRIKNREYFRPFAPSVLAERAADYFDPKTCTPYMIVVSDAKPGVADRVPAVIHVDDTARVHTVSREDNPRYHRLLSAFDALTGEGLVLNTSFNEREPIVCSPADAVDTFLRVGIDVLVMGNQVARNPNLETT